MSGESTQGAADAFAARLRELKDRSGLSYGTLAKRLHMSTSTLHRYCNGTAVPTDYAPVERLARLCKATPQELVALHRQWVLADANRGRRTAATTPPEALTAPDETPESSKTPAPAQTSADSAPPPEDIDLPGAAEPPARSRRRPTALVAGVAAVTVLGAVVLAVNLPSGGDKDAARRTAAGATAPSGRGAADRAPSRPPTASASTSPSASTSATGSAAPSAPTGRKAPPAARPSRSTTAPTGTPLTVSTRPYVYESACSQHFLVDSGPAQMGPPAGEQDAQRWASAYGAVSSGEQRVGLTVQGTGHDTVVLEALHVRVVSSGAPLAWNDYSMGVGCGGGVETKSFDVNLDAGTPTARAAHGQRDFPYKVSESDPEVFYLTARTRTRDVRWDLSLEWSSGDRRGTVHIDNAGTAFRTSANTGRPGYDYPLGGGEWIERVGG
ncbi:helix-turn-helix domain-containing protein [Streptomyces sp. NPDC102406]|uniref:helix-turn-helix domain-containing protein n=1 Tax=Streptomyces sp. NPDC102406 TaxID=3366171 RepID=UPI003807EF80